MNTCADFCTAAKCDELEARIASLEQALALLEAAFEAHTNQDVYEGHNFNPNISISHQFYDNVLLSYLSFDSIDVDTYVDLNSLIISNFEISHDFHDNVLLTTVNINGFDTTTYADLNELLISSFDIDIIDLGNNSFQAELTINSLTSNSLFAVEVEEIEFTPSNLRLDGIHQGDYLYLTVADGESQDTATIFLDVTDIDNFGGGSGEVIEPTPSNLRIDGIHQGDYLYLTVADGQSQDTATIYLDSTTIINNGGGDTVGCEGTEQKIDDCCGEILGAINSLSLQLTNTESILSQENTEIKNELTIDVSGTLITNYTHEFETDNDDDIIPTYAVSNSVEQSYLSTGLAGIHELLQTILTNQEQLHLVGTQGISPPVTVDLQTTVNGLCQANALSTRDDFDTDEGFFSYLRAIVQDYLSNSISKFLLKRVGISGGLPGMLVTTTVDWGISFLIDKLTAQEQTANQTICDAIENLELDTVTLVASEAEVGRIEGNVLVLHFVSLDNYPKRQKGSQIRRIQIPAPKDNFDWAEDFEAIRWEQGNQYAKLKLEGYKQGITGWFKDAASANATFDQLLTLTTATEKGRNIPNHTNPRTDIVERVSRPYRAFISRETVSGQPETLFKYFPSSDD